MLLIGHRNVIAGGVAQCSAMGARKIRAVCGHARLRSGRERPAAPAILSLWNVFVRFGADPRQWSRCRIDRRQQLGRHGTDIRGECPRYPDCQCGAAQSWCSGGRTASQFNPLRTVAPAGGADLPRIACCCLPGALILFVLLMPSGTAGHASASPERFDAPHSRALKPLRISDSVSSKMVLYVDPMSMDRIWVRGGEMDGLKSAR
jgi:hypothetical protein